jgi:hypothetical protein
MLFLKKQYSIFLFVICLFGASLMSTAQPTAPVANRSATKAEWEAAKKGLDYIHLSDAEKKKAEKEAAEAAASAKNGKAKGKPFDFNPPSAGFLSGLGTLGQAVLIGLIIALVAGLFYMLMGQGLFLQNTSLKPQGETFDIADIENNLHETDLDRYLRQAIENGDYRMAVRIYYLNILKQYSLREIIKWKKDKTNTEYLTEVRRSESPTYNDFRAVTLIFERVWYGEKPITAADYAQIKPHFEWLQANLK